MILTAAVAFVVTALAGKLLIPFLHKLHFGQSIREDGPTWHKNKQGTPTMGGIMFILGSVAAALIGYAVFALTDSGLTDPLEQMQFFGGIVMAMLFGLIGFFRRLYQSSKKTESGSYGLAEDSRTGSGYGAVSDSSVHRGRSVHHYQRSVFGTVGFGLFLLPDPWHPHHRHCQFGQPDGWNRWPLRKHYVYCRSIFHGGFHNCGAIWHENSCNRACRSLHRFSCVQSASGKGLYGRYRLAFFRRHGSSARLRHEHGVYPVFWRALSIAVNRFPLFCRLSASKQQVSGFSE